MVPPQGPRGRPGSHQPVGRRGPQVFDNPRKFPTFQGCAHNGIERRGSLCKVTKSSFLLKTKSWNIWSIQLQGWIWARAGFLLSGETPDWRPWQVPDIEKEPPTLLIRQKRAAYPSTLLIIWQWWRSGEETRGYRGAWTQSRLWLKRFSSKMFCYKKATTNRSKTATKSNSTELPLINY